MIVLDLNDNKPMLAQISSNSDEFLTVEANQNLATIINENEIGPLVFDDINTFNLGSKHFAVYDLDMGDNSTFEMFIDEETQYSDFKYTSTQLADYFSFYPSSARSKTSLNLVNVKPIDFDALNLTPFLNSVTGIGIKFIKFNVCLL